MRNLSIPWPFSRVQADGTRPISLRIAIGAAVLCIHFALFLLIGANRVYRSEAVDAPSLLLLIPETRVSSPSTASTERATKSEVPITANTSPSGSPDHPERSRVTPEEIEPQSRSIDWAAEASKIANEIAAADSAHRAARPQLSGQPISQATQSFAWSHSRINRIEQTADGNTIVWINDRCYLVNFLFPGCLLGTRQARGDLFEHMGNRAEFGDWME